MTNKPPAGITPPAPGLDREEPDFWVEDDIPSDDRNVNDRAFLRDERNAARPERE